MPIRVGSVGRYGPQPGSTGTPIGGPIASDIFNTVGGSALPANAVASFTARATLIDQRLIALGG